MSTKPLSNPINRQHTMPIYIYESIPNTCCEEPAHYEIEQEANDTPLSHHPETKEPIERVVIGGRALVKADGDGKFCCCGPGECC